jgi:hypothetical protein
VRPADLDGGDQVAQACHVAQARADGLKGVLAIMVASPPAGPAQAAPIQSQVHNIANTRSLEDSQALI